jgi:hypothetical protein
MRLRRLLVAGAPALRGSGGGVRIMPRQVLPSRHWGAGEGEGLEDRGDAGRAGRACGKGGWEIPAPRPPVGTQKLWHCSGIWAKAQVPGRLRRLLVAGAPALRDSGGGVRIMPRQALPFRHWGAGEGEGLEDQGNAGRAGRACGKGVREGRVDNARATAAGGSHVYYTHLWCGL